MTCYKNKQSCTLYRHYLILCLLILGGIVVACGGASNTPDIPTKSSPTHVAPAPPRQILRMPNVGIADSASLDPALGPDNNTGIIASMIYSGLVRADQNLNVVSDQATWDVSSNNKVYTFHLLPNLTFSDGTPVTADTYVYTLTRALLPSVKSQTASFFEGNIVGAANVSNGKTTILKGVKAVNARTLQITLTQPTPYFLEELTSPIFYAVNKRMIDMHGQSNWPNFVVGTGAGTGPFIVKEWNHNVKMALTPNPAYYGHKTRLTEVDMFFVDDASVAYKSYRAGQYDFVWNILQADQDTAQAVSGFVRTPQLETDALFFNNKMPPFDSSAVRQAFAYATDKAMLAHTIFHDSVVAAPTIIPPGMPGYQPSYQGIPYDTNTAKAQLQLAYPDVTTLPPITFSYPSSLVSSDEANALANMWESVLGIHVQLLAIAPIAYNDELLKHQIQFGFIQWNADFPDPYDCLALNLLSMASSNAAQWNNAAFDQTVAEAEQSSGMVRIASYNIAEQIAIQDVGWLPLDHQTLAAIIPSTLHGITLNGNGLYFGDWSGVSITGP